MTISTRQAQAWASEVEDLKRENAALAAKDEAMRREGAAKALEDFAKDSHGLCEGCEGEALSRAKALRQPRPEGGESK